MAAVEYEQRDWEILIAGAVSSSLGIWWLYLLSAMRISRISGSFLQNSGNDHNVGLERGKRIGDQLARSIHDFYDYDFADYYYL
eukprot:c5216_g1_i1 orf=15-266(-)